MTPTQLRNANGLYARLRYFRRQKKLTPYIRRQIWWLETELEETYGMTKITEDPPDPDTPKTK